MQIESICRGLTWICLLTTAGIVGAALPAAEIKRLEAIVSRRTSSVGEHTDTPDLDAIGRKNAEIRRAAVLACSEAVEGEAYSVIGLAVGNPDWQILSGAIIRGLRKIPPERQKPFLIPALLNPAWPNRAQIDTVMSGEVRAGWGSVQESLCYLISQALGEEVKFENYWSADERATLVERLHTQLGLPIPPGQFTVPAKGSIHSKVRLPSPAPGVRTNTGIGEPGGLFDAAAPKTRETGPKSWLIDLYLVAAIGTLVAAVAVWFFLRPRHSRFVPKK